MTLFNRNCPICDKNNNQQIYSQDFKGLVGISKNFKQEIKICKECGMVYVTPFLSERDLDKYYSNISSYEYAENDQVITNPFKNRSLRQIKFILENFPKTLSAVDIGCSVGYTLKLLKDKGIEVLGIDPSPACREIAKKQFAVEIVTGFITTKPVVNNKFDLVVLSHIVEHLREPKSFIKVVRDMLSDNGTIFIEIPDIDLFGKDDLYQFFFEHINYFNIKTLTLLMESSGFKLHKKVTFRNNKKTAPFYPTHGSLWVLDRKIARKNYFLRNLKTMNKYIHLLNKDEEKFNKKINQIISKHNRISIWGAGTLTARIFEKAPQLKKNVVCLFDSDFKKNNQRMNGHKIFYSKNQMPEFFKQRTDAIIIGSWSSQEEIFESIKYLRKEGIAVYKLFNSKYIESVH